MVNLAEKIKLLRRQKNLTQEHLAETFGVSCQAISKWETASSFPDISLLPVIADYFGVSIDYLLGHDVSKVDEEINTVCEKADELFENREYMSAVPVLREALVKHPGNEKLMYKLAWALSGTLRESPENYEEAILLYQKILEISTNIEMRTKVTRDLIYRFATKEDYKKAISFANELPPFEFCREYNIGRGNLYQGKKLSEYLQSNIQLFGEAMMECLEYFVNEKIITTDEMLPYTTETAIEKIELLKKILA